jgi:hypothetical protein
MVRVCIVLCVLAALALVPGVAAASAQPRPSVGAISSEEPRKATDTTAPEGEDTRRHPTGKKEEGQRPTMLYVKNNHPAGILTDVHVHMPRKVSEPPNADPGKHPQTEARTALTIPNLNTLLNRS